MIDFLEFLMTIFVNVPWDFKKKLSSMVGRSICVFISYWSTILSRVLYSCLFSVSLSLQMLRVESCWNLLTVNLFLHSPFSSRSFFSLGLSHTTLWENQSITCQLFHGAGLRGEKSALHLAPSELQKRQVFSPLLFGLSWLDVANFTLSFQSTIVHALASVIAIHGRFLR